MTDLSDLIARLKDAEEPSWDLFSAAYKIVNGVVPMEHLAEERTAIRFVNLCLNTAWNDAALLLLPPEIKGCNIQIPGCDDKPGGAWLELPRQRVCSHCDNFEMPTVRGDAADTSIALLIAILRAHQQEKGE